MKTVATAYIGTRRHLALRENGVVHLVVESPNTNSTKSYPVATSAAGCSGLAGALIEMGETIRSRGL